MPSPSDPFLTPAPTSTRRDVYRSIASVYDRVTGRFMRAPHQRLAGLCHTYGVRRILDMGCGTGLLTARLSEAVAESAMGTGTGGALAVGEPPLRLHDVAHSPLVVGLDLSEAMLRVAAEKRSVVQDNGRSFSLVRGDAAMPPFVAGSFDAVACSLMLHEVGAAAERIVAAAFTVAPLLFVLDWRSPERNLDYLLTGWIHGIERLAGREHYQGFRHYLRGGGLYGLADRTGATVLEAVPLNMGSLLLAVLSKNGGKPFAETRPS